MALIKHNIFDGLYEAPINFIGCSSIRGETPAWDRVQLQWGKSITPQDRLNKTCFSCIDFGNNATLFRQLPHYDN